MATDPRKSEAFWKWMRLLFHGGRWLVGAAFAIYFIPNLILFGKWTRLSTFDYVSITRQNLIPVVKAIKEYNRDHGELPKEVKDLVPTYLPVMPPNNGEGIDITPNQIEFFDVLRNEDFVLYLLSPPSDGVLTVHLGVSTPYQIPARTEGWYLESGFVSGQIPLPPVAIDASTSSTAVRR